MKKILLLTGFILLLAGIGLKGYKFIYSHASVMCLSCMGLGK
jgi:hypothetical protein